MSLIDHAMRILGVYDLVSLNPSAIRPGFTVTRIDWHGCMATERVVEDVGDVVEHSIQKPYGSFGLCGGVIVKWDKSGTQWVPYELFRRVNDELEVWR